MIIAVYRSLSARLICEGTDDRRSVMNLIIILGADVFWTLAMILELALHAVKNVTVAISLFLLLLEYKLIVESFLRIVDIVRSIGIWFPKKQRKPPDKNKSNTQQINLVVTLILLWSLDYGK